jgi:flagellar basal-body rod protein FlgG
MGIRALYTAASGMNAQQANIDNIAHNLANVNTVGFKKSRVEFEDLVYQQIKMAGTPTSQEAEAPVGLEAGLGSRAVATARSFSTGSLRATQSPLDLAIEGQGFLQVTLPGGETGYTRAGALHLDGQGQVVTAEGYSLEPQLTIPADATSISISKDGIVSVAQPGQQAAQQVGTIELANFQNPAGLMARGGNLFTATTASGEPTTGLPGTDGLGTLAQGFVEDSNVSVVEEMVNMILGQRAYEANSKVIRTADEMLQQVNQLSR